MRKIYRFFRYIFAITLYDWLIAKNPNLDESFDEAEKRKKNDE